MEGRIISNPFPRPNWSDWFLVIVGVAFSAAGAFLWRSDRNVAIMTIAFFGSGAVWGLITIARKIQLRRTADIAVNIPEGAPIRPKAATILIMGLWLLLLGLVLSVFTPNPPFWFYLAILCMIAPGALLLLGWSAGKLPAGFVQLDPDALVISYRQGVARIPWAAIGSVRVRNVFGHVAIALDNIDPSRLTIDPPNQTKKLARNFAWANRLTGSSMAILQQQVGVPLPSLFAEIGRRVVAAKELSDQGPGAAGR